HLHPMRFPPRRSFGLATSALAVALTAITAGATAACGDADVGDSAAAILSIQGEADLSLPAGGAATLVVRYHDGLDQPLAGRVEFVVLGDGGALAAPTALATEDGLARIEVRAERGPAAFRVRASAADAGPVEWSVVAMPGDLALAGRYRLTSHLHGIEAPAGALGAVMAVFLDLTDGPHDPASFLLDRIAPRLGGLGEILIEASRPGLDAAVNAVLREASPG